MIKKLVRALSRIPGLASLRRYVDEPLEREERVPQARAPELRASRPARKVRPAGEGGRVVPQSARSPLAHAAVVKPTAQAAGKPTAKATQKPTAKLARESATKLTEKPAAEFAGKSTTKLTERPAAEFAVKLGESRPGAASSGTAARPGAEGRPTDEVLRSVRSGLPAEQRLGLAAVGPGRAFAFWKLSTQAIRRARQHLREPTAAVVLRVYDITLVDFDGSNARRTMDGVIEEAGMKDSVVGEESTALDEAEFLKGSRYLELWTTEVDAACPSRVYSELGVRGSAGDFVAVAWSPVLDLPTGEESPHEPRMQALVNGEDATRHWRPRVEPRRTVSSPPLVSASAGTSTTMTGETERAFAESSDSSLHESSKRGAPRFLLGSPSSAAVWTLRSPSSAELVARRDLLRGAEGISSSLLGRREKA